MKVAICGVGPAGLFAAWAARDHQVTLLDRDVSFKPERIFALQYLHAHCDLPVAARKEMQLTYRIDRGSALHSQATPERQWIQELYNLKVGRPVTDVNSTRFAFDHPKTVFSLKTAYTWLYREFERSMHARILNKWSLWKLASEYDVVISTVPLNILFPTWPLEITTMMIAQNWTPIVLEENECVMNIDPKVPWTRTSRIDGGTATEFVVEVPEPDGYSGPEWDGLYLQPLRKVVKPKAYPDLPSNVILAGRWGLWDPKPLSHDTYYALSARLEAGE